MLLVLIAVALAALLSLASLHTQSTSAGVSRNLQSHPAARIIAESGLVLGIALVHRSEGQWREQYGEGEWASDHPYAGGTFTLIAEGADEAGEYQGGLFGEEAGEDDGVLLTSIGAYRGVTHIVRARMAGTERPGVPPGLQDRDDLPPGLRKRLEAGEPPPGLVGRGDIEYRVEWIERP